MKREHRAKSHECVGNCQRHQKCKSGNSGLRQTLSPLSKDTTAFKNKWQWEGGWWVAGDSRG